MALASSGAENAARFPQRPHDHTDPEYVAAVAGQDLAPARRLKVAAVAPRPCGDCGLDTLPGQARCHWCQELADLRDATRCTGEVAAEGVGIARCTRTRAPGSTWCAECRKIRQEAAHVRRRPAEWLADTLEVSRRNHPVAERTADVLAACCVVAALWLGILWLAAR